jgi:hypothetical protein
MAAVTSGGCSCKAVRFTKMLIRVKNYYRRAVRWATGEDAIG